MYNIFRVYLFLITLILCLAWYLPISPEIINNGLDPSWKATLDYAFREKLSFGQDVVFTYGPLSFLSTKFFHPSYYGYLFAYQMLIAFVFALMSVLFLEAKKYSFAKFVIYISTVFIAIFASQVPDVLNFVLPVCLVIVLNLQKLKQYNELLKNIVAALLLILISLTLLAKGSTLLIVIPILLMLDLSRVVNKKVPVYSGIATLVFIASWLIVGQPLKGLVPYFATMFELVSGYSEMAIYGLGRNIYVVLICAVVLLCLAIVVIWSKYKDTSETENLAKTYNLIVSFLSVALLIFLSFKSGFVRHDSHESIAFFGIICAALLINIIYFCCVKTRLITLFPLLIGLSVTSIAFVQFMQNNYYRGQSSYVSIVANEYFYQKPIASFIFVKDIFSAMNDSEPFYSSLFGEDYDLKKRYALLAQENRLPNYLEGETIDIFPWDQTLILSKGWNLSPRPVLQSYSVYTPKLVAKNLEYYLSYKAPEYIAFSVKTIDDRYPSIDDGALWPIIWQRYEAIDLIDGFLVLKKRDSENENYIVTQEVYQDDVNWGEGISVDAIDGDLIWLQGEVSENLLGKIVGLLFKTPIVRILVTFEDGSSHTYRILTSIFESGFLLSPYISSTSEFALSQIKGVSSLTNIKSVEFIDTPRIRQFYRDRISLDISKLRLSHDTEFVTENLRQQIKNHEAFLELVASNYFEMSGPKELTTDWLQGRNVLLAHANSQARVNVPELNLSASQLQIEYGIADRAYSLDGATNGVIFNVIGVKENLEQEILFSDTLDPLNDISDHGVHQSVISLDTTNYQDIIFETLMDGDSSWDWSYWSNISFR